MNTLTAKIVLGMLLCVLSSHAAPASAKSAIAEAAAAGKFLCLVFYDVQDESFNGISSAVTSYKKSAARKISLYTAKISIAENKEIADKYGIQVTDLPMLLVIAPNGAVTGGAPRTVTADQLKQFTGISELMQKVIKPLQERKVALVALQNPSTKSNAESWLGVNDFANDPLYKDLVAAIKADPAAAGSQEFVKQCQLIAPLSEATVVVLMPPGKIAKVLSGKLTKADILKSLQSCSAGSGCCSGH